MPGSVAVNIFAKVVFVASIIAVAKMFEMNIHRTLNWNL